jgi:hypothetical protein
MKKPVAFLYVVLLLAAGLLAACGQIPAPIQNPTAPAVASPATTTPKPVDANTAPLNADACTLLSKDEVGTVLAEPVGDATGGGLGGVCVYTTQNFSFELTVSNTGGIKYMQSVRTNIGDLALVVPGLGDEAFYNTNSFINTLFLRKGDAVYLIDVMNAPSSQELSPEDLQAKEKVLAVLLLSHLQ